MANDLFGKLSSTAGENFSTTGQRGFEMDATNFDGLGPEFAAIAATAVRIVADPGLPIWLYVEVDDAMVDLSIFQELSDEIRYIDQNEALAFELSDQIMDAWEASTALPKWAIMELVIRNGAFRAQFDFMDLTIDNVFASGRRDAWLRKRFETKRITYPTDVL